eukprot:296320-Lingulodinium_polyedra.AAC.1
MQPAPPAPPAASPGRRGRANGWRGRRGVRGRRHCRRGGGHPAARWPAPHLQDQDGGWIPPTL